MLPVLALSVGDVSGIGPEIAVRVLRNAEILRSARVRLYGPEEIIHAAAERFAPGIEPEEPGISDDQFFGQLLLDDLGTPSVAIGIADLADLIPDDAEDLLLIGEYVLVIGYPGLKLGKLVCGKIGKVRKLHHTVGDYLHLGYVALVIHNIYIGESHALFLYFSGELLGDGGVRVGNYLSGHRVDNRARQNRAFYTGAYCQLFIIFVTSHT